MVFYFLPFPCTRHVTNIHFCNLYLPGMNFSLIMKIFVCAWLLIVKDEGHQISNLEVCTFAHLENDLIQHSFIFNPNQHQSLDPRTTIFKVNCHKIANNLDYQCVEILNFKQTE